MQYDSAEIAGVFGRAAADHDTVIPFLARFGATLLQVADLSEGEPVLDVDSGRGDVAAGRAPGRPTAPGFRDRPGRGRWSPFWTRHRRRGPRERVDTADGRRGVGGPSEPQSLGVVLCKFVSTCCRTGEGDHRLPVHPPPRSRCVAGAPTVTGRTWAFIARDLRRNRFLELAALRTPTGIPLRQRALSVVANRPGEA